MYREKMTLRERWEAVLRREKPDRLPMDYWAIPETTSRLMDFLGCDNRKTLFEKLHLDVPLKVGPRYAGPRIPRGHDVFGCVYRKADYGSGIYRECVHHPLSQFKSVLDIRKKHTWPDPDWWDYSALDKHLMDHEIYPVQAGHYEPFLIFKHLRGEEQSYIDLIKNPEIVDYCLDRLLRLSLTEFDRIYDRIGGKILFSYVSEDLGGQNGLLYAPEHIRNFILPRMKQIIDLVHQAGAYVFHHNDGSILPVIPDLIDSGIDILNPIQWQCRNMDRKALKKRFGSRLIFHGGMDNQHTLVFGSQEDVEHEVIENIRILGKGGGYILAPCHNLQAITPPENIITIYRMGYEFGRMSD